MKRVFFISVFATSFLGFGQSVFISPLGNFENPNFDKNNLQIGYSYQFKNSSFDLAYNLSDSYMIFGSYQFQDVKYNGWLFDNTYNDVDENGFVLGLGYHFEKKESQTFKNELLAGFESKNTALIARKLFSDTPTHYEYKYNRYFTQINLIKEKSKIDWVFSGKLSYLNFYDIKNIDDDYNLEDINFICLDPTVSLNWKPFKTENFIVHTQTGVNLLLNGSKTSTYTNGDSSVNEVEKYGSGLILLVGVKYNFQL